MTLSPLVRIDPQILSRTSECRFVVADGDTEATGTIFMRHACSSMNMIMKIASPPKFTWPFDTSVLERSFGLA